MGIQKANSPSLGQFQHLLIPVTVVEFVFKTLKGSISLVLDTHWPCKSIVEFSDEF